MLKKILSLMGVAGLLFGACSDDIGRITINETYKPSFMSNMMGYKPFVELKFIDNSLKDANLDGWEINITKKNGDSVVYPLDGDCSGSGDDDYISIELNNANELDLANGTTITLKDADGKYVDYLKIGDIDEYMAEQCDYDYDIDADSSSSLEVDIYRDPDGTGDWITESKSIWQMFSSHNSECNNNNNNPIVVNDDDDADDGDGCDTPKYHTIREAIDAIKNREESLDPPYTIKVCSNENNKSAYSEQLLIDDNSLFKDLVIERADKSKPYYIQNDDVTPIIIDNVDSVTIQGAVIDSGERGIEFNNSIDKFVLNDVNISADKCGLYKIHQENKFMSSFKMYGGSIVSKDESAICLRDINDSECINKFFSFSLKAPKFGFNMVDNVKGCMVIANADIDADNGAVCSEMNVSMTHSKGKRNRLKSKFLGIRLAGINNHNKTIFGFRGLDITIDKGNSNSMTTTLSDADSCDGDSSANGYGIYVDEAQRDDSSQDFNYTIDDVNIVSDDKGAFINSGYHPVVTNLNIDSANDSLEINNTYSLTLSNLTLKSSNEFSLKLGNMDKPYFSDISSISKKGVFFRDVTNPSIIGKNGFKKLVSRDGDGIYFAGKSDEVTIKNVMLKVPNGNGFVFEGTANNFTIENNYFLDIGKSGIYFKGPNNQAGSGAKLTHNLFYGDNQAITIENQSSPFELNVSNNTFFKPADKSIDNDEDDIVVDSNYWGSYPFGEGKSDKNETPTTTGDAPKSDNHYLKHSPVDFEILDLQFDECDDSDPTDNIKPLVSLETNKSDTSRYDLGKINSSLEFNLSAKVQAKSSDGTFLKLNDEVTFMAWVKREGNGTIIASGDNNLTIEDGKVNFNLNIDGQVKNLSLNDKLNVGRWYQIIACYDGDNMMIYTDGEKNVSQSASGYIENYDTNVTIGGSYAGGTKITIDEPRILRFSICNDENVKKVFEYENQLKEYYTARDREGTECAVKPLPPHNFEAKDKGRDDNNISTLKYGNELNLTIFVKEGNFSGKVWAVIQDSDNNISEINESEWNEESEKNITIKGVSAISKDAYIYIKYDDNTTQNDDGETNSTDHFAIIPAKYLFDIPAKIKAGETYSIEVNTTDKNGNRLKNYNQTLDGTTEKNSTLIFIHKDGTKEDNETIELSFDNGVASKDDFNISDVGNYRLELNDTNFAKIDKDDTAEKDRTIFSYCDISVVPYKFRVLIDTNQTSNGKSWLYHSKEFNYSLKARVEALNKDNQLLKHFDRDEYSTDVDSYINFDISMANSDDDFNLTYLKLENGDISSKEIKAGNGNYKIDYTIKDSNFSKGRSSLFGVIAYIEKNISNPVSPISAKFGEVNSSTDSIDEGTDVDANISYYYPRIETTDLETTITPDDVNQTIIVYDKNKTDAKNRFDSSQVLIDWYLNKDDDFSVVNNFEMRKSSNRDSSLIDINISKEDTDDGYIQFTIDNNTTPKTKFGYVHLDTPLYLWYSKYNKKYDYSEDSSCLSHYCFEYSFEKAGSSPLYDVGSGTFSGTESNNTTTETNSSRHGVKIYR
jgi:hypothetical protein